MSSSGFTPFPDTYPSNDVSVELAVVMTSLNAEGGRGSRKYRYKPSLSPVTAQFEPGE